MAGIGNKCLIAFLVFRELYIAALLGLLGLKVGTYTKGCLQNCLTVLFSGIRDWVYFFLLFMFNWRITALQYCVGFCHTSAWLSHKYTYVPSLLNLPPASHPFPPLEVVIEPWLDFPESYSKFPLAIYMFPCYYLHLSPSLSPLPHVHKSVLETE